MRFKERLRISNNASTSASNNPPSSGSAGVGTSGGNVIAIDHSLNHGLRIANANTLGIVTPSAVTQSVLDDVTLPPHNTGSDGPGGWKSTAYSGTKLAINLVKESSDVLGPLKSVSGGLSALIQHRERWISNKEDAKRLVHRIESLSQLRELNENDLQEMQRRKTLNGKLIRILATLKSILGQNKLRSFLRAADQSQTISAVIEDIRDAITDYQTFLQEDIYKQSCDMIESDRLSRLPHAKDAEYCPGDDQGCLKGTRMEVLQSIEEWAVDSNNHRVYWLNGHAGSGKTTIAQTFSERALADGRLGASFFCSRNFDDRSNIKLIFPTLAFQLAYRFPAFRAHLLEVIKSSSEIGHDSMSVQLEKLVIGPLKQTGLSTVIVIDALDECKDDEPASIILSLLSRYINDIPSVKFFITGRPETRIRTGFRLPLLQPQTEVFVLHEVGRSVDRDIRIYIETRLPELVINRSDLDLRTPWPPPMEVDILVKKASGLFIFAATAVKVIASSDHQPQARLTQITSMPDSSVYEGQTGIDSLYAQIFEDGLARITSKDSDFFLRLRLIVGSIVILFNPLSCDTLAMLLGLNPSGILTSLRSLHSLLLVPTSSSQPIHIFHKSFPDYLTDSDRCKNPNFYVDPRIYHTKLAICCLELMKAKLKKNICLIPPYAMNKEISDLPIRRKEHIGDPLEYACRFWAKHLRLASTTGDDFKHLLQLLEDFAEKRQILWFEALSLVEDLRAAVHGLRDIQQWLTGIDLPCATLLQWIIDGEKFVLQFFDLIQESVSHLYHSALPFTPKATLLRKSCQDDLMTEVTVLLRVGLHWGHNIRTMHTRGFVRSLAFSRSGDMIAVSGGCKDSMSGFAELFDAGTGESLATYNGHMLEVNCISFSPDDNVLATASSDHTVKLWDVQTGAHIKTLQGDTGVYAIAFSSSGTKIASGGDDGVIRIWDTPSGNCECISVGTSKVTSICWSPTGAAITTGDEDGAVKQWLLSGVCSRTFAGHAKHVLCIASSTDGSMIASGSMDKTIQLYDSQTGSVVNTISEDGPVTSVCFSPTETLIVYAAERLVRVCESLSQHEGVSTFAGHGRSLGSVTFSPNGKYIASGDYDGYVNLWQTGVMDENPDVDDHHSDRVLCVRFSTKGQWIASGSDDTTVRLWDASTGSLMLVFRGHDPAPVTSITFSSDDSLLVSGCTHGTLCIWDVGSGSLLRSMKGDRERVTHLVVSPDDSKVLSLSGYPWKTQTMGLWKIDTGDLLAIKEHDNLTPLEVDFSEDQIITVIDSSGMTKRWRIHSATSLESTNPAPSFSFVPLPDERHDIPHSRVVPDLCLTKDEVWVLYKNTKRLLWVPPVFRGRATDHWENQKLVLGGRSGRLMILDFKDVPL